ncbi:TPA: CPBP family intramembrane metalloprotease [Corynebacterium striatum]|nr:CPBP family intramembrane metalloprotease [Corynebacterium striatum]HAT1414236.1 CPBP family intramembrane metalloprotease [Corynebacterium striatum]HAT6479082.1 CPBP family intramembrane metalloprotease [Corynebacterium striatum]HAT6646774.1 CPBP family intramembrane metalloprotease [Corynebacterium striatum]HAT6656999.1 CPBP family intramembrane metalloprotease [Corynebacterium striatum]
MVMLLLWSLPTLIYLLLRRQPAVAVCGLGRPWARGWAWAAVMLLVVLVLSYLALLPVPPEVVAQTTTATTAMGFLAMALRAVGEEIFFRGFLQGIITQRWNAGAGITVQGLLFGLIHLPLAMLDISLIPLFVLQIATGFTMGWLREKSASLWPGATVHATINVLTAVLLV